MPHVPADYQVTQGTPLAIDLDFYRRIAEDAGGASPRRALVSAEPRRSRVAYPPVMGFEGQQVGDLNL